jgi:glycosyltransferase involved in cell wall biosynthesis
MKANLNPKVTLGMPVYNGQVYIKQTLDSIVSQKFQDFELIISDNGSLDSTREICEAYAAKDKRIRFYPHSENRGAAWNYNYVLNLAKGEYFKWVAHDDVLGEDFLRRCVEVLDQSPDVVLVHSKTVIIDDQGKETHKLEEDLYLDSPSPATRFNQYQRIRRRKARMEKWESNPIFGLMRTSKLRKTPGLSRFLQHDIILLGELSMLGKFDIVPEYLFYHRYHSEMSHVANKTDKERLAWFDPTNKSKLQFPKLRQFFEYLKAINRVSMSKHEKIQCYYQFVFEQAYFTLSKIIQRQDHVG